MWLSQYLNTGADNLVPRVELRPLIIIVNISHLWIHSRSHERCNILSTELGPSAQKTVEFIHRNAISVDSGHSPINITRSPMSSVRSPIYPPRALTSENLFNGSLDHPSSVWFLVAVVVVGIDGHNRRWIDGSIPILSIDAIDRYYLSC
jgi:hypothetical protein